MNTGLTIAFFFVFVLFVAATVTTACGRDKDLDERPKVLCYEECLA